MNVPEAFAVAIQHHQAGRLAEAESLYRQIVAVQGDHADAWHNLGLIADAAGRHELGAQLVCKAIALSPNAASSYFNLGGIYRNLKQPDKAITAYRRALELKPDYTRALINLANVLQERGQLDEAIAANRQALQLDPGSPEAHNNLGNALLARGQIREAITSFRGALEAKPDQAEAYYNLGVALIQDGQAEEAMAAFRRMIELRPGSADAHNNLGGLLLEQKRVIEGEANFRRAIALRPGFAEAHSNLGKVLAGQRRLDEAVAAYRHALQLDSKLTETRVDLGNALKDQGRLDEALTVYREELELDSSLVKAHSNLVYTLHFHSGVDEAEIAGEQERWNQRFAVPARDFIRPHGNDRNPSRRLRIGYVSGDFRNHVVGWNLAPLFEHHDREACEIFCYAEIRDPDALTEQFRRLADHWRNTFSVADEAVAEMIRQDEVDVLVDLSQHLARNRLTVFAREPAPVQVSFAGYPAGTGVETIGYRISDRYLEGSATRATQERVLLVDSFWCYSPWRGDLEINALPATRNGYVTFGSLNSFCKINEPMLRMWAHVLNGAKDSRLVLLAPEGTHTERARGILEREGVDPGRVEFLDLRPRAEYLALYQRLDIVLDPFPYNGHTTGLDALWMGVPVVTLAGKGSVARAGLSQLSNLGLPELAAFSPDDYVRIADELAHDLPRLAQLRATLRSRMESSILMDAPRFARQIEAAYRAMWRQWCAAKLAGPQPNR